MDEIKAKYHAVSSPRNDTAEALEQLKSLAPPSRVIGLGNITGTTGAAASLLGAP